MTYIKCHHVGRLPRPYSVIFRPNLDPIDPWVFPCNWQGLYNTCSKFNIQTRRHRLCFNVCISKGKIVGLIIRQWRIITCVWNIFLSFMWTIINNYSFQIDLIKCYFWHRSLGFIYCDMYLASSSSFQDSPAIKILSISLD